MHKPRLAITAYDWLQAARAALHAKSLIRRVVTYDDLPPALRDRTLTSRRRVLDGRVWTHRSLFADPVERRFETGGVHLTVLHDVRVSPCLDVTCTRDGWILASESVGPEVIEQKIRGGTRFKRMQVLGVGRPVMNLECGPKRANFYHFWFDSVTKLLWLTEPEVARLGPSYLLHTRPLERWQQQLISAAAPPEVELLRVDTQALVAAPMHVDLPAAPSALLDPAHIQTVRRWARAIATEEPAVDVPARLYVTRRHASRRRILNETDVVAVVEKFGFRTVVLEELAMQEQIRLFAGAEAIVAQHGAALTNVLHAREGTRLLEIQAAGRAGEKSHYRRIADAVGLVYGNMYCQGADPHGDAVVPVNDLARVLERLLDHDRTDDEAHR